MMGPSILEEYAVCKAILAKLEERAKEEADFGAARDNPEQYLRDKGWRELGAQNWAQNEGEDTEHHRYFTGCSTTKRAR